MNRLGKYVRLLVMTFILMIFSGCAATAESREVVVSFETYSDTSIESQSFIEGNYVVLPVAPERNDFVFEGWYLSDSYITEFNFSTPVMIDITLHAKWGEPPYDLHLYDYFVENGEHIVWDDSYNNEVERYTITLGEIKGIEYSAELRVFGDDLSKLFFIGGYQNGDYYEYVSIENEYGKFYSENTLLTVAMTYNSGVSLNFNFVEDSEFDLNNLDETNFIILRGEKTIEEISPIYTLLIEDIIDNLSELLEGQIEIPFK